MKRLTVILALILGLAGLSAPLMASAQARPASSIACDLFIA